MTSSPEKNLEKNNGELLQHHPSWFHQPSIYNYEEEEINLLELWRTIYKRKWQILGVTFSFTLIAILTTFILPVKYTAEVTIMPLTSGKSKGGLSAMASQLGSIPLLGGLTDKLSSGKSKELVNILKSRTLSENIITRFDLLKVLFANQYDAQTDTYFKKFLKPIPVIEDGVGKFKSKYADVETKKKTGLIKVEVTMQNPVLAASVANGMVAELQDFINNNSVTLEKRNRIFIEEQLVKNRAKLLEGGKKLSSFYGQK